LPGNTDIRCQKWIWIALTQKTRQLI